MTATNALNSRDCRCCGGAISSRVIRTFDSRGFGSFIPFFFVGTGIKFDLWSITGSTSTMLLVPISLALFLLVRGAPVFLYRSDLTAAKRTSFALYSSVASLSLVVVITEIGVRAKTMSPQAAQCSSVPGFCPYCCSRRLRDSFFINGRAVLGEATGTARCDR